MIRKTCTSGERGNFHARMGVVNRVICWCTTPEKLLVILVERILEDPEFASTPNRDKDIILQYSCLRDFFVIFLQFESGTSERYMETRIVSVTYTTEIGIEAALASSECSTFTDTTAKESPPPSASSTLPAVSFFLRRDQMVDSELCIHACEKRNRQWALYTCVWKTKSIVRLNLCGKMYIFLRKNAAEGGSGDILRWEQQHAKLHLFVSSS